MAFVPSFLDLLQPLSAAMTARTFDSFVRIPTGRMFARRRTVTGVTVAAGAAVRAKHHSAYHRVFAAARWSLHEIGLAVLGSAMPLCGDGVLLAVDDTLARKRGLKVFGVGMHLSTRRTAVMNWGHCWVVLGVVVRPPFCGGGRSFCLPVLLRPYVPQAGRGGQAAGVSD